MYLVRRNFHGNGIGKIIGEFLSEAEEKSLAKLDLESKGIIEKFSGKDGDDEHLNSLNLAELRALLFKKIEKFNHSGKSEDSLREIYRGTIDKSKDKPQKSSKASKKASKKVKKK